MKGKRGLKRVENRPQKNAEKRGFTQKKRTQILLKKRLIG
jgi:hypothetical protein